MSRVVATPRRHPGRRASRSPARRQKESPCGAPPENPMEVSPIPMKPCLSQTLASAALCVLVGGLSTQLSAQGAPPEISLEVIQAPDAASYPPATVATMTHFDQ